MQDIGARSLTAVFWGSGGAIARIVLQFGAQVVLARLLGPEQFGLFAIGAVVVSFSNFFADVGIAYGLIQKANVTATDLRFITTWQFIIGTLVTLAVALAGNHIAFFFWRRPCRQHRQGTGCHLLDQRYGCAILEHAQTQP